jgi:hypothetical protein
MRWASRAQKIPSFRAILLIATEPQKLAESAKSVSDRLLSLFTRTSSEKVRIDFISLFYGISGIASFTFHLRFLVGKRRLRD